METQEPQEPRRGPGAWYRNLDAGRKYLVKLAVAGLTLGFVGWLYVPRAATVWHYGDQLLGGIVAGLAIAILIDRHD